MTQQVKTRHNRTDWTNEGAVPVVPPHERRSASAQADRALRASSLVAHSDRIMESLQEERSHNSGYTPATGPTGEKPIFTPPPPAPAAQASAAAAPAPAPAPTPERAKAPRPAAGASRTEGAQVRQLFETSEAAPQPPVEPAAESVTDSPAEAAEVDAGTPPAAGIPQLIRELAGLRDDGILSEEEFSAKKSELLARL